MSSVATRVLVPLDGSVSGERALRWAERLAEAAHLEFVLFRVVLPPRAAVLVAPMVTRAGFSESEMEQPSDEYLRILSIDLREKGLEARYETACLEAAEESVAELRAHFTRQIGDMILSRVEGDDIDFVAMASHGMTSQMSTRWGSVTKYILTHVSKPVLIVPVR